MVLNDMTSFWSRVQDQMRAAIGRTITEELVVATRPGAVTVRPFVGPDDPDPGSQELRSLSTVSVQPGDRVLVMRTPAIKAVIGKLTIRGVDPGGLGDAVPDHSHHIMTRSGRWYGPHTHGAGMAEESTYTVIANRQYFVPFYVPNRIGISDLAIKVTTAIPGSTARMSIYHANAPSQGPNTLIASTGAISTAATGVVKTGDTTWWADLETGWYWLSFTVSDAVTVQSAIASNAHFGSIVSNPFSFIVHGWVNRADTVQPPFVSGITWTAGQNYPLVGMYARPTQT